MYNKLVVWRRVVSIFALVAVGIMVATLFTTLFGGPIPLLSSSGTALAQGSTTPMVSAGNFHTVGLKFDGTVVAVGCREYGGYDYNYGQLNVSGWRGIVQVAAGGFHTVGLKSTSTVVAVGDNSAGACNVSGWNHIVQVAAGDGQTVGLKSDGHVVAVGSNDHGERNVSGWSSIVQVAAGRGQTVGLKSYGAVVAVGDNSDGQLNVSGWRNIVQVAAGHAHTVGLKSDGTVVAVGNNEYGQCNVSAWTNIIQVAAGAAHTVGLKSDGTVVAVGYLSPYGSDWTGIVQVAADGWHTVGLRSDGTVVADGDCLHGECNVSTWQLGPGTLTVTAPNGGERWARGTTCTITWTSAGSTGGHVKIELLKGGVLDSVITSITFNNGSYSWPIPSTQIPGTDYRVRISSAVYAEITDQSDSDFRITPGTLTVIAPNGGEKWMSGTTHTIWWTSVGSPGEYVRIELLNLVKGTSSGISKSTENDGSYSWPIPSTQPLGTTYRVRISSAVYPEVFDVSNSNFQITKKTKLPRLP